MIPPYILQRPPSAELRPGQVASFDYETVAPAMERLVRENRSNLSNSRFRNSGRLGQFLKRILGK